MPGGHCCGHAAIGGSDHHVLCYHFGRTESAYTQQRAQGRNLELEIGLRRCAWRSAATAALQQRKLSTAALETTDPEPNRPIVGLKTVEALLDREVLHANEELTARHVGRGRAPNEQ